MTTSTVGKEHHGVVHGGRIYLLYEIVVSGAACLYANASSSLCSEFCQRSTLDVSHVADGYHHFVVGIEILGIELVGVGENLCTSHVVEHVLDFQQLLFDYLAAECVVGEYLIEVFNLLHQVIVFGMQLILLKSCQLCQTHIHDGFTLNFIQSEALFQCPLC